MRTKSKSRAEGENETKILNFIHAVSRRDCNMAAEMKMHAVNEKYITAITRRAYYTRNPTANLN